MTEDDAKKKWCPFCYIGYALRGQAVFCIASDCMMWRTTDNEVKSKYPGAPIGLNAIIEPAGYCGLAGRP